MEAVRIHIKRLGAVRDSMLETKPLMVFSGESGLGKSYVSFLIHYIYVLLNTGGRNNRLITFFNANGYNFDELFKKRVAGESILRINSSEIFSWINRDAINYVGYLIGHPFFVGDVEITFPYAEDVFNFVFEEEITGIDNHEESYYKIVLGGYTYRILSSNVSEFNAEAFAELIRVVLYNDVLGDFRQARITPLLPPSRGALMELYERPKFVSGMYEEFMDFRFDLSRPSQRPASIPTIVTECLAEVNRGKVQNDGNVLMYYTSEGITMPLTAAASSIKEMAPITLMLAKYSPDSLSVLLEEPEAHLHPQRQAKVADLIGCLVNLGCHLRITTHSDYFIKRLNGLIKLRKLQGEIPDNEFERLLNLGKAKVGCLIDPELVGAYFLKPNGDGTSTVVSQDIGEFDEIPFDSFYGVIEEDLNLSREIRRAYGNK